ncbi:uncharacterized protein TM35_000015630 [Trypanosoma theileri]|uniref:Uncharacterized protein n=1 Tax=Trypanosoma theileri TaxID=67003 RepID=A0A1X0P9U4_9TRYP|nr:uncharacterized protein TM35_000015630 [Trypanosoma theileri]ORC93686.1 hypothetical protein TM35_000015630 [Trypanosoma theileri]
MKKKVAVVDGEDDSDENETPKTTTKNRSTALEEELKINPTKLHTKVSQRHIPSEKKLTCIENSTFTNNQHQPRLEAEKGEVQLNMRLNALSLLLEEKQEKFKPAFFMRDSPPNTATTPPIITVEKSQNPVVFKPSIKTHQKDSGNCEEDNIVKEDSPYVTCSYSTQEKQIYNLWRENMKEIHTRSLQKTVKIADKLNDELAAKINLLKNTQHSIHNVLSISNSLIDAIDCFNNVATECYPALCQHKTTT